MKKVYLLLALFMTSLFFFSTNKVSADMVAVVDSSAFDYIDDDFLRLRELAIEYCNENDTYYLIQNLSGTDRLFILNKSNNLQFRDNSSFIQLYYSGASLTMYNLVDNELSLISGTKTFIMDYLINRSAEINYAYFLDTNMDTLVYTSSTSFTITYNDLSYVIEQNTSVPSLYQIYLDSIVPEEPEEPPVVENEVLSSFYSTVITKIGYLVETISSNQVYLSIIVIFILIFIIELIFRRFI